MKPTVQIRCMGRRPIRPLIQPETEFDTAEATTKLVTTQAISSGVEEKAPCIWGRTMPAPEIAMT